MNWRTVTSSIFKHLRLRETWVIFFVLGIIMMSHPFLSIFNKPVFILGIPLLYLYLLIGWFVSICVIFLFTHAIDLGNGDNDKGEHN